MSEQFPIDPIDEVSSDQIVGDESVDNRPSPAEHQEGEILEEGASTLLEHSQASRPPGTEEPLASQRDRAAATLERLLEQNGGPWTYKGLIDVVSKEAKVSRLAARIVQETLIGNGTLGSKDMRHYYPKKTSNK